MALNDLVKPVVGIVAVAAVATAGFAAGYLVARDPQLLRRLAGSLAGGIEKLSGAIAMAREEVGDLWAEARDGAQQDVEAGPAAEETVVAAGAGSAAAPKKATARRPSQKKRTASTRQRAAGGEMSKSTKTTHRR